MSEQIYILDVRELVRDGYQIADTKPTIDPDAAGGRWIASVCPECGGVLLDFFQDGWIMLHCMKCLLIWPTTMSEKAQASHIKLVEAIIPPEQVEVFDVVKHIERLREAQLRAKQEYFCDYYKRNREQNLERSKRFREINPDYYARYRKRNLANGRLYWKRYYEKEKETINARRRARRFWQKLKTRLAWFVVMAGPAHHEELADG